MLKVAAVKTICVGAIYSSGNQLHVIQRDLVAKKLLAATLT
jgi:hypothetical protein